MNEAQSPGGGPPPLEQYQSHPLRGTIVFVAMVVLGAVLGAVAHSWVRPVRRVFLEFKPRYMAEAQITVERLAPVGPRDNAAAQDRIFVGREDLDTLAVTLGSGRTAYSAMKEFKLEEIESFKGLSQEEVLQAIVDGVSVFRGDEKHKDACVVHVRFTGPVAADCRRVVNAMISVFQADLQSSHEKATEQHREIYRKMWTDAEARLVNLKIQYRKLQQESPFLLDDDSPSFEVSSYTTLRGELGKVERDVRDLDMLQSTAQAKLKEGAPREVVLNWLTSDERLSPKWEELKGPAASAKGAEQDLLDLRLQAVSIALEAQKHRRDVLAQEVKAAESRVKEAQTGRVEMRFLAKEIEDQQRRLDIVGDQLRQIESSPRDGYIVNRIKEPGYGQLVESPMPGSMAAWTVIGAVLGGLVGLPLGMAAGRR